MTYILFVLISGTTNRVHIMSIYLYEYGNRNTDIYFQREGNRFIIRAQKYISPGVWRCRVYSTCNYDNALEFLEYMVTLAKGGKPSRNCAFAGENNKCSCRAKNCPAELGAAAYWQIFHRSCPYRAR